MLAIILLWLTTPAAPRPPVLLITAENTPIDSLAVRELRALYLGQIDTVHGVRLKPLNLKRQHPQRRTFEVFLFGKHFDWSRYWLEKRLQGGPDPPKTAPNEAFMLVYLERNPGMIGYLPRSMAPELAKFKLKLLELSP